MKKVALILLLVIAIVAVAGAQQDALFLVSGGYMESHLSYDWDGTFSPAGLPNENFKDTWTNWLLGTVHYLPTPRGFGIYNATNLFFLENLTREYGSTTEKYQFSDFRLGINNINGLGTSLGLGPLVLLIGGGIHWDAVYISKYPGTTDSNYWMLNLGLGAGVHLIIPINERIGIQLGTQWWWDPFQLRTSSSSSISDDYSWGQGWGYNVTGGISISIPTVSAQ